MYVVDCECIVAVMRLFANNHLPTPQLSPSIVGIFDGPSGQSLLSHLGEHHTWGGEVFPCALGKVRRQAERPMTGNTNNRKEKS